MAYWLFCQACKQWSKFATPLSEDKYCSYCNSSFIAPKQPIQPTLANLSTVPAEDTQPQMSQTEEAEVSQADDSLAVVQPDSAEIDTDLELQTIEVKEKATEDKAAQTPEDTTPQESLETTESEDDGTALEIAVESTVPEIDEVSQEPRESTSEYSSQFSDELDGTSEIQEPPADQPENLESAMIFDGPEVTEDAKMEEMPPGKEPYHPTTAPSTAKIVFPIPSPTWKRNLQDLRSWTAKRIQKLRIPQMNQNHWQIWKLRKVKKQMKLPMIIKNRK